MVNLGDYPWVAFFNSTYTYEWNVCTASLISPRFALTAAHCTDPRKIKSGAIKLGTTDYYGDGVEVRVKKWYPHEGYQMGNEDSTNDISLLEVKIIFQKLKIMHNFSEVVLFSSVLLLKRVQFPKNRLLKKMTFLNFFNCIIFLIIARKSSNF